MKQFFTCILFTALLIDGLWGQDTFSIIAVDSVTGEVGSAGASCLDASDIAGGASIISDIIPGRGGIHTQSFWRATNQNNARARMLAGDSPDEIMTWLSNRFNDVDLNSTQRQYGAAAFDSTGSPQAAAFTGANCLDWKGHRVGKNYAIQGNILLGPQILDSMEVRFLRTEGSLSDRLMAALQGANVPGADSRCLNEGVSSQSAFLRVAGPNDHPDSIYLDIIVDQTPFGQEPIDSVQVLYDAWKRTVGLSPWQEPVTATVAVLPDCNQLSIDIDNFSPGEKYRFTLLDITGRKIAEESLPASRSRLKIPGVRGFVVWQIATTGGMKTQGKLLLTCN
ncbi:MAG: DUF1028 domain-containing protein [Bacteroidia bacterium]